VDDLGPGCHQLGAALVFPTEAPLQLHNRSVGAPLISTLDRALGGELESLLDPVALIVEDDAAGSLPLAVPHPPHELRLIQTSLAEALGNGSAHSELQLVEILLQLPRAAAHRYPEGDGRERRALELLVASLEPIRIPQLLPSLLQLGSPSLAVVPVRSRVHLLIEDLVAD